MITLSNVIIAQGSTQPKIKVTNTYLRPSNINEYWEGVKKINYKGKELLYNDSIYKLTLNIQVSTPTKLKCSLYVMKKDYPNLGMRGYMQGQVEGVAWLTDINQTEKIYEFPVTTVTVNDNSVEWDWDGFTWEINGKRYPIRDWVAPVLEDAETGELLYFDSWSHPGMDFMPFNRYDHYFESEFEANQNSVSAHIYFVGVLPAKNATVFLGTMEAQTTCYIGALSNTVVNQGGKAIVEDMNRRSGNNSAVIAYKELGSTQGGEKINDLVWENITDINGKVFIPEESKQYIVELILEGENMAMNDGFYEGQIGRAGQTISIPMPKALQPAREPNTGAPYHVEVPGTLAALLGNKIDTITVLNLSGSINGYDMETLYKMKKLTVLDMSRVDIVSGGDPYSDYYTNADKIPENLFKMSTLSTIALPNNATAIQEKESFFSSGLTTMTLGSNFQYFPYYNDNFRNLKEYIVPEKSKYFSSIDGVLFNKGNSPIRGTLFMNTIGQTTLIGYPAEKSGDSYTIPEGTAIIGEIAFRYSKLKHLVIPSSVTLILSGLENSFYSPSDYSYRTLMEDIRCYNPTPPKHNFPFDSRITESCKLYVPKGSKAAYAAAEGWKDFKNIIEMSGASIDIIPKDNVAIQTTPSGISVESPEAIPIVIYLVSGQKVYEDKLQGNRQISLNKGIYLVKVGETVKKIIVK